MSDIVANSPTHSLPNVSCSDSDIGASRPTSDEPSEIATSLGASVEVGEAAPSGESEGNTAAAATQAIPIPSLQRTVSTSPRLEHVSDDARRLENSSADFGQISSENDLFFPFIEPPQGAADLSVSLPSSGLYQQSGNIGRPVKDVHASDTVLSAGPSAINGHARNSSLQHLHSRAPGSTEFRSPPSSTAGGKSGEFPRRRASTRKDSSTSIRSRAGSIFGSKLFETLSTTSMSSQRINIISTSPGVEPVLFGHYSTSYDEGFFPHEENRQTFAPNFRASSMCSGLQSKDVASRIQNGSLQRTLSLPSKYGGSETMTSGELQEEILDGVSELAPAVAASTSVAKRKWQMTMPELTEGPETDTLTAHGQKRENLAAAALAIIRGEYKDWPDGEQEDEEPLELSDDEKSEIRSEKRRYIRNLLVLSVAYFFLFSAYFALRNLQSSLNAAGGLGLYALSSMYCSLIFGGLFATTIVQRLRPKRSLCVCLIGFGFYSAANFYPSFYTLIPASMIHGFFFAVLFTAQSTYLTNISAGYAELAGKQTKDVLSRFHGTYFVFLQLSQVSGSLVSSLLLSRRSSDPDASFLDGPYGTNGSNYSLVFGENVSEPLCGSSYCPAAGSSRSGNDDVDPTTLFVLMGCFGASTIAGSLIMIFLLEPLDGVMKRSETTFRTQMTAVFRFFLQRRARYVIGLSFYSLLEISFMFGEFTKAFVTCSLGVQFVGYIMLTLSIFTGTAAYVSGNLQQYIGRMPLIVSALCVHFILLVVLCFWSPSRETLYVFFIVAALWGVADGMLMTQLISLLGTLFESNKEPAFAAHKICQALSAFVLFATAPYLCTQVKMLIVMTILFVALSGYIALEVLIKIHSRRDRDLKDEPIIQELVVVADGKPGGDTDSSKRVVAGDNVDPLKEDRAASDSNTFQQDIAANGCQEKSVADGVKCFEGNNSGGDVGGSSAGNEVKM